jgi:hypothetical protein
MLRHERSSWPKTELRNYGITVTVRLIIIVIHRNRAHGLRIEIERVRWGKRPSLAAIAYSEVARHGR